MASYATACKRRIDDRHLLQQPALSSKRGQRHVVSRGSDRQTDRTELFHKLQASVGNRQQDL